MKGLPIKLFYIMYNVYLMNIYAQYISLYQDSMLVNISLYAYIYIFTYIHYTITVQCWLTIISMEFTDT